MAMGSIRSGGDSDEDGLDATPMSEINVTPMVDVMLVLLIIFMVAAPLMTTGVPVQLPKTAAAKVAQAQKPLEVSIDKDGSAFIAKEGYTPETLLARLRELKAENPDQVVLVRGDRAAIYDKIMEVMGLVAQAGFTKVSLIAQSPGGTPAGASTGTATGVGTGPAGAPAAPGGGPSGATGGAAGGAAGGANGAAR